MINKHDHIHRVTAADETITDVIRKALADNFERIPFTHEGGFIATDLGETESDEDLHITISGHQENGGPMYQNITVICFDTKEKADRFRYSPESVGFDDPYGDGQDSFDLTVLAGDPRLPGLIATILKNYFGFKDNSKLCAHTYCEVDYFRKEPVDAGPHRLKS